MVVEIVHRNGRAHAILPSEFYLYHEPTDTNLFIFCGGRIDNDVIRMIGLANVMFGFNVLEDLFLANGIILLRMIPSSNLSSIALHRETHQFGVLLNERSFIIDDNVDHRIIDANRHRERIDVFPLL